MKLESQFEGLAWADKTFGPERQRTVEPDIRAIEQTIQSLRPESTVQVTFLVQGGFNKIYDVKINNELFIMRVSLPVDPDHKTGIGNTYKAASILGDSTTGEVTWPAEDQVHSNESPLPVKENVPGGLSDTDLSDVGRIVSMHFFWGSNVLQDVNRGPFGSSKDWITSRLSQNEKYCVSTLENLPSGELGRRDANKADDATRTLEIVRKLQTLLPSVFPPAGNHPEPPIMVHDDLSSQNILVHDSGELTAILDWECVSALPVWIARDYPAFLQEKARRIRPELGNYELGENGEPSELYWEHLLAMRSLYFVMFILKG
ncbi:hypothetical protein MYU51_020307 [Penicillium brevicompactum]